MKKSTLVTGKQLKPGMTVRFVSISGTSHHPFRTVAKVVPIPLWRDVLITYTDGTQERWSNWCDFQVAQPDLFNGHGAGLRLVAAYAAAVQPKYRLVWTSIRANSERTLAGSPMDRDEALRQFGNCSEIRKAASAGRGRLRVMADAEYRRILAGEQDA